MAKRPRTLHERTRLVQARPTTKSKGPTMAKVARAVARTGSGRRK